MRHIKRNTVAAALIVTLVGCGLNVRAQGKDPVTAGSGAAILGRVERPLSEKAATRLSALGTIIPTGLGVIIAATRNGQDVYYVDWSGYSSFYHDDPDQTAAVVLIGSGLVIGPSLGYLYAGRPGRAFLGMGFRTAVGFGALIGAFATCGWDCGPGEGAYDAAWGIMALGGGLVAASAIYDIAKVGSHVRAQNRKHQSPKLSVLPEYFPGHKAVGLRAKIAF
ncbi:hypothetical protein C3F09_09135 [candidate division GN15 bacterium]|uniref:Uncharacterized protein n=1 Tax=candidate division GN15 bacterium TaxID=2072418 RepID=A0A855X523_9BACT|nr:MAG: hypothetical protein C3F09_09135 [candidate division GN15 bacterium]